MVQIIKALPIIAAFIGAANAHAHVWGIAVNGVAGGTGANGDARYGSLMFICEDSY